MDQRNRDSNLLNSIEPVVEGLGFYVVEFTSRKSRSGLSVNVIIYRDSGINMADCTAVYKTILPRIEMLEDSRDVHLEVSSPGISRNIKTTDEFKIFLGRKVKILNKNDSEWIHGMIDFVDNNSVNLNIDNGKVEISFEDINKAKLE
ncbi:MAG: ribosome assembly cofactor RimP [Spirochaetales bacterium]|nr:ribosome assembly cofactor RimP [Spirochaetales bacterium]